MHAERDLIIDIAAAWHSEREVVVNTFAEIVHEGEPVCCRKIDARLPFLGAALQTVWRDPDLHCKYPRSRRIPAQSPSEIRFWQVPTTAGVTCGSRWGPRRKLSPLNVFAKKLATRPT